MSWKGRNTWKNVNLVMVTGIKRETVEKFKRFSRGIDDGQGRLEGMGGK